MNKSNTVQEAGILAASQGGSGGAQDRLAALLEVKIAKELQAEQAEADQRLAFKTAQINAIRKTEEQKASIQEQCPHMKPNFRPATGGQKDHSGKVHMICQYCQKEFGDNLPYHLRLPSEMVGGPQ